MGTSEQNENGFWGGVGVMLAKTIILSISVSLFILLGQGLFKLGYSIGFSEGQVDAGEYYESLLAEVELNLTVEESLPKTANLESTDIPAPAEKANTFAVVDWGGPELWEEVNERRQEFGVNPLSSKDELCTIASIRLNELLKLNELDAHEGFSNMRDRRPDLGWIFDNYSTVAEFLAMGGSSAEETVSLWENTLGHKKLLTGGEYVWGCIYAQNSFAVAITAF
jgi:hypothetical protein